MSDSDDFGNAISGTIFGLIFGGLSGVFCRDIRSRRYLVISYWICLCWCDGVRRAGDDLWQAGHKVHQGDWQVLVPLVVGNP